MEFTYYGGGRVLLATKDLKIALDPPDDAKLKGSLGKADVRLATVQHNGGFKSGEQFKIDGPGEFEIKNVGIRGVASRLHIDDPKDPMRGVMYILEAKGLKVLATGNIAPTLSDRQVEAIGGVDVLIIPVGGHGLTLDATAAAALVSQFEPSFVVPVHYQDGKTKYEIPQDKIEVFLKEIGSEGVKPVPKLKISEKDLQEGAPSVVVLEVQA